MPESFGVRLRQQRERQRIALATISEQTKIKLSLLEELERDDVSHWPTGIFRRAFVRAYAHAIGLDQDIIVREFLEVHPEPPEIIEADPALSPIVENVDNHAAPPMRLRYLVGSALDSLFGAKRGAPPQAGAAPAPATPAASVAVSAPMSPRPVPASPQEPADVVSAQKPVDAVLPQKPGDAMLAQTSAETILPQKSGGEELPQKSGDAVLPRPTVAPALPQQSANVLLPPKPADAVVRQEAGDLVRLARLCSDLARLDDSADPAPLFQDVAETLDAIGFVVWAWDSPASELRPFAAHGYSDRVLAQLPRLRRDADNATAAAFQSAQATVVRGRDGRNGALAIPIVAPSGCVGVLAIEVKPGGEDLPRVRAFATMVAALLARLVEPRSPAAGQHEHAV
jgi:hypothetical protein